MVFIENILDLSPDAVNEILGRIFLQSEILMPPGNYPEAEKFSKIIDDVMHKLFAMLYHKTNYIKKEQSYIDTLAGNFSDHIGTMPLTGYLSFEFEAFLFQTKSSLDLAIKILEVLFPGKFHIHTFSKKGNKLIENLQHLKKEPLFRKGERLLKNTERLMKVKNIRNDTLESIINRLIGDKIAWLEKAIKMRDDFAHYTVIKASDYKVERITDKIIITPPKLSGEYPRDFMEITFRNCLDFIQDFFCLSVGLWLPPNFRLCKADMQSPTIRTRAKIEPDLVKYVKYQISQI